MSSTGSPTNFLIVPDPDSERFVVFFRGERTGEVYPWIASDYPTATAFRRRFVGQSVPAEHAAKNLWTHERTDNFFVSREAAAAHLVAIYTDKRDFDHVYPAPEVEPSHKWQVQIGAFGSAGNFDTEIEALRWIVQRSPCRVQKVSDVQGAITKAMLAAAGESPKSAE